jgi:hypothetical protein
MNPGQFTVRLTRAEADLRAMKWRRTLRRRTRRAEKSKRYGDALHRTYAELFRDNLEALARADQPAWRPWMERADE